jgi:hypothetical protein
MAGLFTYVGVHAFRELAWRLVGTASLTCGRVRKARVACRRTQETQHHTAALVHSFKTHCPLPCSSAHLRKCKVLARAAPGFALSNAALGIERTVQLMSYPQYRARYGAIFATIVLLLCVTLSCFTCGVLASLLDCGGNWRVIWHSRYCM